jgi:hypothetical protein
MISIGNGELQSVRTNKNGTKTYHWYCSTPHVTYLLSQTVGEFAEIEHDWKGVNVQYYGPKGRAADIERTLQHTPKMLEVLSDATGLKYPYSRYAQTYVADFIFGGMENITATTLTDTSLLDKRAWLDRDADGLLAHELAHQWFGDLLTCREWAHAWLNEGFATYFEALFTEQAKGIDEFRYELYQNTQIYMSEDSGHYRRPIVHNVYNEPIDIFDRHLYEKGSLVLHMIRTVLGDERGGSDPPLRRDAQGHERDDAGLPARDRAGDGAEHRLAVRRVCVQGGRRRSAGLRLGRQGEQAKLDADAGRRTRLCSGCRWSWTSRWTAKEVRRRDQGQGPQLVLHAAGQAAAGAFDPGTTS